MFSKILTPKSTAVCWPQIERLKQALDHADAVVIGAGAGLSASAGLTYSGERFERYFKDFQEKYGIQDMYSGGMKDCAWFSWNQEWAAALRSSSSTRSGK